MEQQPDYTNWSTADLINRVTSLEQQLKAQAMRTKSALSSSESLPSIRQPKNPRVNREFDPSKYSTRLIALKFAYLGQRYNGLEFHPNNETPLPTVEEELWKALNKARLVFPTPNPLLKPEEPNWEGCEYSKCGRTDKGVSAFGQVVGIRVRSNRPLGLDHTANLKGGLGGSNIGEILNSQGIDNATLSSEPVNVVGESGQSTSDSISASHSFDPINDELPYCQILNRLLPPDIRILAWCPNPPTDFSARFSCKERQYRYFFTQPAFAPTPCSPNALLEQSTMPSGSESDSDRDGYLNIPAMRTAAHKFIGLHDFRNFCKIDASKQIENFERRIFHADIQPLSPDPPSLSPTDNNLPSEPTIFAFTLHGSAFLWHQVRHMIAILFLIGQNLESPSLIDDLLDIKKTPCKPQYEMADDAPLVLWDCLFPTTDSENREDALEWVYANDSMGTGKGGKGGVGGLEDDIWRVWRGRKMDEVLASNLMEIVSTQSAHEKQQNNVKSQTPTTKEIEKRSQKVFQGGDSPRLVGRYIPVMQKPRMESVEAINSKYAKRKGFEQDEGMRERGFRRVGGAADEIVE